MATAATLPIDTTATATDMANAMFGDGITLVSATYTGAPNASGLYSGGDTVAPGITPSDEGVILSTGNATSVTNAFGDPNVAPHTSTDHFQPGDADLSSISGDATYDASVLEASFIPEGSTLTMQFVFSSEEYLEFVNSGYNDAIGVWVNGTPATLAVGDSKITVDNINDVSNANLYVDNPYTSDTYNTEMDGFTVTLTLKAPVIPDQVNTIKIGIADSGDPDLDSNLMIAANSVQTELIAGDDDIEVRAGGSKSFDLISNDYSTTNSTLTITHINGQPVSIGDTITLTTGETITVTASGVVLAGADGDLGTNVFTYKVADELGNTDIGFVNMTTVAPCFVAGTMIDTACGPVPVEELEAGDMIITLDHGPQPLRWTGRSQRRAEGKDAPVHLSAGALGPHEAQELSPNHRILLSSARAEVLFGTHEVLIPAKELVNDQTIRRRSDGGRVTYVHLLFDRHEIIRGNGLWSESYHPGLQTAESFDHETGAEILRLFPQLEKQRAAGYGPTARMVLKHYEARVMLRA